MAPQAFDRLARSFRLSTTRRRALGGLLGGALITVVGGAASASTRQRRSPHGPLRGVPIEFVNATTADISILDLPHLSRTVRPQDTYTGNPPSRCS